MFNYNTKKSSIKLESINIKEKERIKVFDDCVILLES